MKSRIGAVLRACGFLTVVMLLTAGCVSQEKFDELAMANRNCEQDRERLTSDLANAQVLSKTLQDKVSELEGQVKIKDQKIGTLEGQVAKFQGKLEDLTDIYRKLLEERPVKPIEIVQLQPELDKALKEFAAKYPDLAKYDSKRGVLKFGSDVLFDLGSDTVKARAAGSLNELAGIIASPAAADFDVVIVGHTDNVPIVKPETAAKHPTNWHLSVHRSIAVMRILRKGGVAPERMGVMGHGEYRPVAPNDTPTGRTQNRRVEVFLVPKQRGGEPASEAPKPEEPKEEK